MTQIYDQHLEPLGLTVTQYSIIGHLRAHDGISVGALADMMMMDPTTLTRSLKPMENKGWVASTHSLSDGRTRRLHVTLGGTDIFIAAKPHWQQAQQRIAAAVGDVENARLAESLEHLLTRLTD